jgi:hypothetical protein
MKLICRKALFAGCLAVLAACEGSLTGVTGEKMELSSARRRWSLGGVDDYRMTVDVWGAWMGGTAVIEVRNGVPVSVEPVGESGPGMEELFGGYDTVEELFGILERAVADDAYLIDASYHVGYGVPVEVSIDHREGWADDEHGFRVQTFDRL